MSSQGWIAVDLDCTLAIYPHSFPAIGPPIQIMVERVKGWLAEGKDVRIFTARVAVRPMSSEHGTADEEFATVQRTLIEAWCLDQFGCVLPVTACKDFQMIELWDDRCVQMESNTGKTMIEVVLQSYAAPHAWQCGCGAWSGLNLDRCGQCTRPRSEAAMPL